MLYRISRLGIVTSLSLFCVQNRNSYRSYRKEAISSSERNHDCRMLQYRQIIFAVILLISFPLYSLSEDVPIEFSAISYIVKKYNISCSLIFFCNVYFDVDLSIELKNISENIIIFTGIEFDVQFHGGGKYKIKEYYGTGIEIEKNAVNLLKISRVFNYNTFLGPSIPLFKWIRGDEEWKDRLGPYFLFTFYTASTKETSNKKYHASIAYSKRIFQRVYSNSR